MCEKCVRLVLQLGQTEDTHEEENTLYLQNH